MLISCQGKDSLILYTYTESFTNAFLISVTDLISWMSIYLDASMVFFILKSVSMQKEWKNICWLRLYAWNLWYEIMMWFTFSLLSVISHQKLISFQNTFDIHSWVPTPRSLDQRQKAFIMLGPVRYSLFLQLFLKILPLVFNFFFLFSQLTITGSRLDSDSRKQTSHKIES